MITVIGGGPAGRSGAINLALAGYDVRLVEKRGSPGGQCLHHGCMVICGMNDCARLLDQTEKLCRLSVFNAKPELSVKALLEGMSGVRSAVAGVLERETLEAGVGIINAEAHLCGADVTVRGKKLDSDSVLIATGSKPFIPEILGNSLGGVYTPHTITGLENVPEKTLVVGGGFVAAEYSYILSAFGSDVTTACRSAFLNKVPAPVRHSALKDLKRADIKEHTSVKEICGKSRVESVVLEKGGREFTADCDAVLFATGLVPNTDNISGISKGNAGEILINSRYESSVRGVFAAGDVTGKVFMTPYARMQGRYAAESIMGKNPPAMPACIPQTLRLFYDHSFCFGDKNCTSELTAPAPAGPGSFWSVPERNTGRASLSISGDSGAVSGVCLSSPSSSDVLAYMAYLIENGVRAEDLKNFMGVHPSGDGIPALVGKICAADDKMNQPEEYTHR